MQPVAAFYNNQITSHDNSPQGEIWQAEEGTFRNVSFSFYQIGGGESPFPCCYHKILSKNEQKEVNLSGTKRTNKQQDFWAYVCALFLDIHVSVYSCLHTYVYIHLYLLLPA